MKPAQRRAQILELIYDHREADVAFLAEALDISPETIRRDLAKLAAEGRIHRNHGGASVPLVESAFQTRMEQNLRAKRAIAGVAAQLFQPGESLFIDTGSTTVIFGEALSQQQGLSVITNSVLVAQQIARGGGENNRVFVIGGEYRDGEMENVGPLALEQIKRFQARHAVLTISAINATGVMDYSPEEAEVARAMIAQAESLTVLCDASKFSQSALFKVCDLNRIDRLIADKKPDAPLMQALKIADVELIVAG